MSTFITKSTLALAVTAATVAAAPGAAHADGFGCTASAVRADILGQVLEPVRAGSAERCETAGQALDALGAPLASDAASAQTAGSPDRAMATTSLTGFRAGALSALTPELPQVPLPSGIGSLPVSLPASAKLLGLPAALNVDATEAARALVEERKLPEVPLVGADLVSLGAGAACDAGRALLDSLADVQGLTALGTPLAGDQPIDTAVPLAPAQVVDFATLDLAKVVLPGGLSLADPVTGPILRSALQSAVAGLPTFSVPAAVGRVVVDPAHREPGDGSLRQVGPRVRVEVLGRQVADVTLGDALVSALGIVCGAPEASAAPAPEPDVSPATEAALSCATSDVVLTDVVEKDGKVKLVGVADGRFVGRTIDLVLTSTGETVATAVVQPDGYFRARAPLPRNAIRWTNKARYQAVIDGERSLALKLHRRMRISRMKPAGDTVTIAGRIYGRMAGEEVVITRRESCTEDVEVTTVKPGRDGRWRVTLPVPEGVDAATFRATTLVRKGDNPKRFRTFTLPGHVAL